MQATKARLTPHQQRTLDRLTHLARHAPVREEMVGSSGALHKLEVKGYAVIVDRTYGPRGGERRYWAPTMLGKQHAK